MTNAHRSPASNEAEAVAALIQAHVTRYPVLTVTDVYRLLHQAVFGVGTRIPNRKTAREWLDYEASLAAPDAAGLLVESVHPAGEVVRVYLPAYRAAGGSISALLDAYIKSSEQPAGDPALMLSWWAIFTAMIAPDGALAGRFEARVVTLTGRMRAAESWAALAHSPSYIESYHPFYRVLTRSQAEGLLRQQNITFRQV
jgi:hypothetical protein